MIYKDSHEKGGDILFRLAKNSFFIVFTKITNLVVSLLGTAMIARYLGIRDFGHYALVMAMGFLLMPLIDFGFERIVAREIAADKQHADKYFGTAFIVRIILSISFISILYLAMFFLQWERNVIYAMQIAIMTQIIISMGMLAVSTFRAYERMEYEFVLNFIFNISYILILLVTIFMDMGFLSIFMARLIASLLHLACVTPIVLRSFIRPSFEYDIKLIRYLFKEGLPLCIFAFFLTATINMNTLMLKKFVGPEAIGMYEAASRIIIQFQLIPTAIMVSLFPFLSRLANESIGELRRFFFKSFKVMLVISLPLPIIIMFISNFIVKSIYGNSFADAALPLSILSFTIVFQFLVSLQSFVLSSNGMQFQNTISGAACFITNIVVGVFLIPRYGYVGACLATLAAQGIFFLAISYFTFKMVGAPKHGEMTLSKPIASFLLTSFAAYLLNIGVNIPVALEALLIIFIYLSMLFFLKTFSSEEVSIIRMLFVRKRPKKEEFL